MIYFRNVSLFSGKEFGISRFNLEISNGARILLNCQPKVRAETLVRILEGKAHLKNGFIDKPFSFVIQSDRLLMQNHDKNTPRRKFFLKEGFTNYLDRKRSKHSLIDQLNAKHILDLPLYKLNGQDRVKYALLSLLFQESGLMILFDLLQEQILSAYLDSLVQLFKISKTAICLVFDNKKILLPLLERIDCNIYKKYNI